MGNYFSVEEQIDIPKDAKPNNFTHPHVRKLKRQHLNHMTHLKFMHEKHLKPGNRRYHSNLPKLQRQKQKEKELQKYNYLKKP